MFLSAKSALSPINHPCKNEGGFYLSFCYTRQKGDVKKVGEKVKRPLYKKKRFWLIIVAAMAILYAIGTAMESTEKNQAEEPKQEKVEKKPEAVKKANSEVEEEKLDKKIDVEGELVFAEFKLNLDKIRIYEEDGKAFADIEFNWLNQAGDGKKMFMQLSAMDARQGEKLLDETSGAWDPLNKNSSRVYFPNAENGEIGVDLTYQLENTEDPISLTFVPLSEEDSGKIDIEIN